MSSARGSSHARSAAVGIGLVGTKFMGRAHSIAWANAPKFFDLPMTVELACAAGRDAAATHEFGRRWGWRASTSRWRDLLKDPSVTLIDVASPNDTHALLSIAALESGRHVACEKPLARTLKEARAMRDAARLAARRGLRTFVWFNYRRAPAVALAHRLVRDGRIGRIFHIRAAYLQDWGGASTPLLWRFQSGKAGSGAHGDLNAHIIDMARFISGLEFRTVVGGVEETFIRERAFVDVEGSTQRASKSKRPRMGRSTVDDCLLFLARMSGGAVASFEATRLATGNKNRNCIEINGERGSVKFDFERMNELDYWDATRPAAVQGWTRIMCTDPAHPYAANYWPAAHLLGYEHGFISQAADIVRTLGGLEPEVPLPDFSDAYETQRVLEAAQRSARFGRSIPLSTVT
ncbi:MAG: Gfo/Idh/MocA family oxidoreductase [Phycisphaerales bacterium]|nr:Gfo/Idh/MocA family oxidoreductase [Phycisphaerales bacterium]